jgi:tRNA-splicing ligase RtcB (3'-phosphate/5'-hydroxy nucleic acid ligase)
MDLSKLASISATAWKIEPQGSMRVPGILFGDEQLIREMDEKVFDQVANVASLPGIVKASYAMPDAHWGYGFPIGGVAAFDPDKGGVVSAGGVGFDISCGVRTMLTGLSKDEFAPFKEKIADALYGIIPAGVGSHGQIALDAHQLDAVLEGGAQWAIGKGYGIQEDVDRIEMHGRASGADPSAVSEFAKRRQRDEMGTLGSGNHYLEVQEVKEIYDDVIATGYGLKAGDIVVSFHCGSRGLGHQVATDFSKKMLMAARERGIFLADRELACAPIQSETGQEYLRAMRAAINCALANRQILMHLTRKVFSHLIPRSEIKLLYDVSHNTCLEEDHLVDGKNRRLFVHRKGATRALPPGHPELPESLKPFGQPVLIGGTMGTASYILAGTAESESRAFCSSCHGAGRQMSRTQATRRWQGREVMDELASHGILIRCKSYRGIAEEAPDAYKNVNAVVEAADRAGLSKKIAKVVPLICVKG